MAWTMRPATADDFDALCDLYEIVFGHRRSRQHDWWKFVDNPAGGRIAVVAEAEGRLVGQYALWPTMLDLGGQLTHGAQSLDTMVHPDHRGEGMFTRLAKATFDLAVELGVKALYGFPNEASYPGFVRRLGWDHTGDIPRWIRVVRPSSLRPMPGGLGVVADSMAKLLPQGSAAGHSVRGGAPGDEALEELLHSRSEEPDTCRVARSVEWLTWRYSPDAQRDYRWVTVQRGSEVVGAAVWGRRDDDQGVLGECLGVDSAALVAACAGVVRDAASTGVGAVHAVTNESAMRTALRRTGFVGRQGAPLIVRSMTHETLPANIHNHDVWRISGGDLDTF